MASDIMLC